MAPVKRIGWALGLLALAFPATAHTILTALVHIAVVLLAHPTAACAVVAGVLLASTLPALHRRTARLRRVRALRDLSRFAAF